MLEQIPINLADIEVGPGVDDPELKKQKLAKKISDDYAELKKLFESDSYDSKLGKNMAKILGKKATLVVGSTIYQYRGENRIEDFWNGVWEINKTVVFNLKWAFIVSEVLEEIEDYDHIAYETFEFHIYAPPEPDGEILKNQTGKGERSCRHTRICNCITR
jgi:hypothetical protein